MSVEITKAVLESFLTDAQTNVLALTGAWGTGKTFTWREAVLGHKNDIKFKRYCYVSLFGITTMADLRMALFTESRSTSTLGEKVNFDSVNEQWGVRATDSFRALYGRFGDLVKKLPYGSNVSLGIEAFAPSLVRDTLVCLDDFERLNGIRTEDLLGLITELREERNCKVALIFNAEKLRDQGQYRAYKEKVIDLEILYAPTAYEAFDLVFDMAFPDRDRVRSHAIDLDITNIRILRRVRDLINRLVPITANLHPEVTKEAFAAAVLLCWCAYAPDDSKPKIEDIRSWNSSLHSFKKELEQDPKVLKWVQRLRSYGVTHISDLDLAVSVVVERGYVEGSGFSEAAKALDELSRKREAYAPFNAVWHRFHDSFSDDEKEFIVELHQSALAAIDQLSVVDLNGTVRVLRELERADLANELIDRFIAANRHAPSAFDLKDHPFGSSVDDTVLRDQLETALTQLKKPPSLEESAIFMVKNSGYNPEHLAAMKNASVDDYHALFTKKHQDVDLSSLIRWSLRWAESEHADITTKAREALTRIKKTGQLNAIRVSRYGV